MTSNRRRARRRCWKHVTMGRPWTRPCAGRSVPGVGGFAGSRLGGPCLGGSCGRRFDTVGPRAGGDRVQEDVLAWLEKLGAAAQRTGCCRHVLLPGGKRVAATPAGQCVSWKWFTVRQGLTFLDSHVGWAPGPAHKPPFAFEPSLFRFGMESPFILIGLAGLKPDSLAPRLLISP